jgi:uncharacterized protein YndB with AHSA1/START domain
MKSQIAVATAIIHAPAETVYNLIADYRHGHPRILPKEYFLSLDVEEGGLGAGTRIHFTMRLLGQTKQFHARITEPEPGRLLVETDINTDIPTSFRVEPVGDGSLTRVTIATELKEQNVVESFIAKRLLQKVYRRELALVASVAEGLSH